MPRLPVAALALALLLASGCGGAEAGAGSASGPRISAALYPLEFLAAEVGGSDAQVTNLSSPGVEPHDLELAPDQVRSLAQADLVLYLGEGFQPAVEDAVDELSGIPVIDGLSLDEKGEGAIDPHVWLDPLRLAALGEVVAAELGDIDPDNAEIYEDNAAALAEALGELDRDYSAVLDNCRRDELVVSHEAFGYLTDRYGLEQIGVSGIDPEAEPSPGRVAEVAEFAEEHGVTTIFFEEQVAPDIAQVIGDEVGAEVEVLDPLEFQPEGDSDYFDVMRTNLDSISAALGCG